MKKLLWISIFTLSIILAYSLIINTRYERPFSMELNQFDKKYHTRLENKKFQYYEYGNSLGNKVTYYFEKQFYDEPFIKIQISEFSDGYDLINYNRNNEDIELTETFDDILIPIKIKFDESIITVKSKLNLNDVYYGICLIYRKTEPDDKEIKKAANLMIQTIDEYIETKKD